MDKPRIRLKILETCRDRVPAPTTVEELRQALWLHGYELDRKAVIVECAQLEACGYLKNLKNALDPVYRGVEQCAVEQLDMSGKLDATLWGDLAL